MHLVSANLWTWIRYVLMEEGVMEREIRHKQQDFQVIMSIFREVFKMINQTETNPKMHEDSSTSSEEGAHDDRHHGELCDCEMCLIETQF